MKKEEKAKGTYEAPTVKDFGPIHEITKTHKKVGGTGDVPQGPGSQNRQHIPSGTI